MIRNICHHKRQETILLNNIKNQFVTFRGGATFESAFIKVVGEEKEFLQMTNNGYQCKTHKNHIVTIDIR